jgi:hypothetical protein
MHRALHFVFGFQRICVDVIFRSYFKTEKIL